MNTISKVTLSAGVLLTIFSCGNKENIYDIDKPGEILEVQKRIIEEGGDLLAYEISINSQSELNTALDRINVVTNENATEGTLNRNSFQIIGSGEPKTSVIDNNFFVKNYKKNDPKKISEIDFSIIEKYIENAKSQIPTEFIKHSIYSYEIEFKNNKRSDEFKINCLKEGESDHVEGRDIVTNYYQFNFEINKNGEVILKD